MNEFDLAKTEFFVELVAQDLFFAASTRARAKKSLRVPKDAHVCVSMYTHYVGRYVAWVTFWYMLNAEVCNVRCMYIV